MKSIKFIFSSLIITFLFISCNNKPSLQKYYVDNQENQNFIVVDIPTSILNINITELNTNQLEAFHSIDKLNFLGYKISREDDAIYQTERAKVTKILTDNSYKTLIKYGSDKQGAVIKYLGSETEIDEIVIFGSDDTKGFGIVRILGKDINPTQIIELVEVIKKSKLNTNSLEKIADFF